MTIYLWTLVVDHDQLVKRREEVLQAQIFIRYPTFKVFAFSEKKSTEPFHFTKI